MEYFSNLFGIMLQQEGAKQLSSGVSMGVDSLSTLVKINSIVKLDNNSYHSLCTSGAFNIPNAIFDSCFNCDAPDHGVVSCPNKKYQKNIAENKKKFIKMKKIQGGSGGIKMWAKRSNKKGRTNKSQKQKKINKKANVNGDTKSNNKVHLVDGKWMCLCNKVFGFNTSRITGFHDTWDVCVQNNQPFTLPATHSFQKKIVSASGTVPQVASSNGGGTQSPPPINGGTDPTPVGGLHHMGAAVHFALCAVKTNSTCEHHNNYVYDPDIS